MYNANLSEVNYSLRLNDSVVERATSPLGKKRRMQLDWRYRRVYRKKKSE
jgi:hypothetical protein